MDLFPTHARKPRLHNDTSRPHAHGARTALCSSRPRPARDLLGAMQEPRRKPLPAPHRLSASPTRQQSQHQPQPNARMHYRTTLSHASYLPNHLSPNRARPVFHSVHASSRHASPHRAPEAARAPTVCKRCGARRRVGRGAPPFTGSGCSGNPALPVALRRLRLGLSPFTSTRSIRRRRSAAAQNCSSAAA